MEEISKIDIEYRKFTEHSEIYTDEYTDIADYITPIKAVRIA